MSDDESFEDALESVAEKLSSPNFSARDGSGDVLENVNCETYVEVQDNEVETENCSCPTNDGNDDNKSEIVIDESVMKEKESRMSEEEKQVR